MPRGLFNVLIRYFLRPLFNVFAAASALLWVLLFCMLLLHFSEFGFNPREVVMDVVMMSALGAPPLLWLHLHDREAGLKSLTAGFCEICGYNLTGNTSGVCPECGTAIPARGREG